MSHNCKPSIEGSWASQIVVVGNVLGQGESGQGLGVLFAYGSHGITGRSYTAQMYSVSGPLSVRA